MTRSYVFIVLILFIAIGALAIRLARLHERPMHVDEAVQAVKTGNLFDHGNYRYDPHEFHGPTLYYLGALSMKAGGCENFPASSERNFRIVPAIFGAGIILLMLLVGDGLGRAAAVSAALLTALSPAMAFYSRYYIQEMLLVFFTFAALAAFWRYIQKPSWAWAVVLGAALGLMHATKETCVIAMTCLFGAAVLEFEILPRMRSNPPRRYFDVRHVLVAAAIAAAVSVTWFSSFFSNAQGPLDSIRTYGNYLHRAGGEGSSGIHDHPWYFYLKMLLYTHESRGPVFSEALIFALALIGLGAGILEKGLHGASAAFVRFTGFYTLAMIAFYSLIPYKTPWCALSFLHGAILLAGVGAVAFVSVMRLLPLKAIAAMILLAGAAHLAQQSWLANFVFYEDPRNPYVYAHTISDVLRLQKRVEEIAEVHPDGRNMLIKVACPDYWPLPWYLRKFSRVGYWSAPPAVGADAPVIITAPDREEMLKSRVQNVYQKEFYGLRPKVFLLLYTEKELWDLYIRQRTARKAAQ